MLGPYVIGARIKALTGDLGGAADRLDEGSAIAESLALPRLRARIDNERIRLGLNDSPHWLPPSVTFTTRRDPVDGIDEIIAQLDESSAIMRLLDDPAPDRVATACTWATEWVHRLEGRGRDRALLQANRLLVACLAAADRTDEAETLLAALAAQCAPHRMSRYLVDAGLPVTTVVDALWEHRRRGWWHPDWPMVPDDFLSTLHDAASVPT